MKLFTTVVTFVLAAFTVNAQTDGLPASIEVVLITALPSSLLSLALTNAASASAVIASELEHSTTPAWFANLPSNVQTYLLAEGTAASTSATAYISGPTNITLGPGPVITSSRSVSASSANITLAPGPVRVNTTTILPVYTTYSNGSVGTNGTIVGNATVHSNYSTTTSHSSTGGALTTSGMTSSTSGHGTSTSSGATSASSAAATATSTSTSRAGAAVPTAVLGAGIAGAVGIIALVAL